MKSYLMLQEQDGVMLSVGEKDKCQMPTDLTHWWHMKKQSKGMNGQ